MAGVLSYALTLSSRGFTDPLGAAGGTVRGFAGGITSLAGKLTSLPSLFAGAVAGAGALGIAFKSIGKAAEMETLQTAFQPLLGSAEAAKDRIAELSRFAAETPFELPAIATASRTLETLTRGALSTGDGLRIVGDVASGTGQGFEEMATTIGRLYDGLDSGRPVGEALARLQELGVISGDTRGRLEQLQKEGKKGAEVWAEAEGALSRFSGSMALQSQTWNGKLSTLKDNVGLALAAFGAPIMDTIKPFLDSVIGATTTMTEKSALFGKNVGDILSNLGSGFSEILAAFRGDTEVSFTDFLSKGLAATAGLARAFAAVAKIFRASIEQGRFGELLGTSLKLGMMEGVNLGATALMGLANAAGRMFIYQFKQVVTLFQGGFSEALGNIFAGLGTMISGLGAVILSKLGDPFLEIVALFSSGLIKSLDLLKEGIGKIPGLNKVFGLEDFKGKSFEDILTGQKKDFNSRNLGEGGKDLMADGLAQMGKGITQAWDVSMGNLKDAFKGFEIEKVELFDTAAQSEKLRELATALDPQAVQDLLNAWDAKNLEGIAKGAEKAGMKLEDLQKIMGKDLPEPKPPAPPTGRGLLRDVSAGIEEKQPRRRGLLNAGETVRKRIAEAQAQGRRLRIGALDRIALRDEKPRRFINPARALEQADRASRAADPRQGRGAAAADPAQKREERILTAVESIEKLFANLATA